MEHNLKKITELVCYRLALLEEETAAHSSILACRIPWTEEPGGLQSIEAHRVGRDGSNSAHTQT